MLFRPIFCCFKNHQPNCAAFTGLGASVLSVAFLIWGLVNIGFKRKEIEVLYIVAFVLSILIIIGFITLIVFLNIRITQVNKAINSVGRIFCLIILIICAITFTFILVSFIFLLIDYIKLNSDLKKSSYPSNDGLWTLDVVNRNNKISNREWAAIIIPSIISIICIIIMAFVTSFLYKVFKERMITQPSNIQDNNTQNSTSIFPNVSNQNILTNNNNVTIPKNGNNEVYPVPIQESQANLKNK